MSGPAEPNEEVHLAWARWLALGLAVSGLLGAAIGFLVWIWTAGDGKSFLEKMGWVGAWLQGAAGSFWTLAGAALVYATFSAQREQNRQQNEAIERNRKLIQAQLFEGTFFQLFNAHTRLVEGLRTVGIVPIVTGRDCFSAWAEELKALYTSLVPGPTRLDEAFSQLYRENGSQLGHYLRSLYNLFRYLQRDELMDRKERKHYADYVRAQLCDDEVLLLLYNGLSDQGEKFKPLIEEFALLKHVNGKKLLNFAETAQTLDSELYANAAFGTSRRPRR